MDPQIKLEKKPLWCPFGEDEIKLVRKKLKWKHELFKIPDNIIGEWREIENKASKKAELHQKNM